MTNSAKVHTGMLWSKGIAPYDSDLGSKNIHRYTDTQKCKRYCKTVQMNYFNLLGGKSVLEAALFSIVALTCVIYQIKVIRVLIIFVPVRYSYAPSDALLELSIYDKTRKTPNLVIIRESSLPNLIIFADEDAIKSLQPHTHTHWNNCIWNGMLSCCVYGFHVGFSISINMISSL